MALVLMFILSSSDVWAQRFSVSSFRQLPNDVSAFIDPVRDLNDEDCGLVKVMASEDFAFSTPLGIVKRIDKVGEIWLYIPRGSKKITLKHPELGVLRDYEFPSRIDSHMTYELKVDEPVKLSVTATMAAVPVITTVTDTLVVTRVDTLVVAPVKKYIPLKLNALATLSVGGKSKELLGGVMLMALRRVGGFVHVSTDFGSIGAVEGTCAKDGEIDGSMPFYSGRTRHSAFMINGGVVQRLSDRVSVFEGAGYSSDAVAWELAPSEGGGYVKNAGYSTRGISFEIGALITLRRVALTASVSTIRGSAWFGTVGIGITLGK
ncbi:MAG: hypothetical protein K2K77_06855 [Duncaniella sp.]|nr:hypothetical protein [Duncaniella sp.]